MKGWGAGGMALMAQYLGGVVTKWVVLYVGGVEWVVGVIVFRGVNSLTCMA